MIRAIFLVEIIYTEIKKYIVCDKIKGDYYYEVLN
jgi:hypothetical protein